MAKRALLWVIVFGVLLYILYPTAFDKRDFYAQTKWVADSLGLLFGYLALFVGISLLPSVGGKMRAGLSWFNFGMFIMGSSFFFGPIINHYGLINKDLVEGIHGLGMLGGMIGYLMALYWFLSAASDEVLARKNILIYILTLFVFFLLYIPTMSAVRTQGNNIKYWAELTSFGLGGVMVVMALRAFGNIGGKYREALNWLVASVIIISLSYPFGPISQPTKLWTGPQGGTFHHGTMAFAILFFSGTIMFLRRLEIAARTLPKV